MKNTCLLFCSLLCFLPAFTQAVPQGKPTDTDGEVPLVLKFEPSLLMKTDSLHQRFLAERLRIDTLAISEKRKQRKIRDLYKDIRLGNLKQGELTDILIEDNL